MKRKIMWLLVSCLMVAALVVTSCGPAAEEVDEEIVEEEEEVVTEEEEEVVAEEEEEEEDAVVEVVAEEPIYGGTLNVTAWGDPNGFDPAFGNYADTLYSLTPVCNKLVTVDWWKGSAGTNEWSFDLPWVWPPESVKKGDLVESWEIISPTHVIYYLRQGVMWQDKPGIMAPRELTADDIVFNYERYMATPAHLFLTNDARPETVTALDRYTVEIKLRQSNYVFITVRVPMYFMMLAPEVIEQFGDGTDWRNVTGTGPFMLTDYVSGSVINYERNPNYWEKDPEGRSLPYLDGFKVLIIPDISTTLSALRTGQLDIQLDVGWEDADSLSATNPELLSYRKLYATWSGLRLDQKAPPFGPSDDPDALKVRRAANMALDRVSIAEDYFQGNAEVTTCTFPPQGFGSELLVENLPASSKELFEYNPEEARRLLAEAGYPDGLDIEISCASYESDYYSLVKAMWDAVGIRTELNIREGGAHWAILFAHTMEDAMSLTWGFNLSVGSYTLSQGIPDFFNLADVIDLEIDRLCEELDNEWDDPTRIELTKTIFLRLIDQAYEIALPTEYMTNFWQPWVGGYRGETGFTYGGPLAHLNYVWLDQDLKEAMGY